MTGVAGVPDRLRARELAFELMVEAQVADTDVLTEALALAADARHAAWSDVRALAEYVVAFLLRWRSPGAARTWEHADAFVAWADRLEAPLPMALARCARAYVSTTAPHAGEGIDDVVHAYEVAERIREREDHAFALHEIGGVLHAMRLWELTTAIYDEVQRLTAGMDGPRALVGSLAYNRHCILTGQLLHAHESGAVLEIDRYAEQVEALGREPVPPAVPDEWRPDIATFVAVCRTLASADADAAIEHLARLERSRGVYHAQILGLLQCVAGWRHMERGRFDQAARLVFEGTAAIGDHGDATWRAFALGLAHRLGERTASDGAHAATRRYRRELVDARDANRDALVRSVQARLQIGRLRAERDQYERESLTDSLTGLANRRALESRLTHVTPTLTMIMIDVDGFKPVNDRFGHDTGDQVLRRIGRILQDCIRPGDLAARLGGDEFVLVLQAAECEVAIRRGHEVCDRVRTEPWHELAKGLAIAVSVGVGWGARTGAELYRDADEGLYHAKRAGGARVRGSRGGSPRTQDQRV